MVADSRSRYPRSDEAILHHAPPALEKILGNAEHVSAWRHSAGRACAHAESTGLRFVFRRILTLF